MLQRSHRGWGGGGAGGGKVLVPDIRLKYGG
jgi:hypothetical protein